MGPIIDCYLTCENPDTLHPFTAHTHVHHPPLQGAGQFTCIAKILITWFSTAISQSLSDNAEVEPLRHILQLTSVICSVRQES